MAIIDQIMADAEALERENERLRTALQDCLNALGERYVTGAVGACTKAEKIAARALNLD